jgi:hypothetical protein
MTRAVRHGNAPEALRRGLRGDRAHEDPIRPGIEPIRFSESREVAPAPTERFLYGVSGAVEVPHDLAA